MRAPPLLPVVLLVLAGFSGIPSARSDCQWDEPTHAYVAGLPGAVIGYDAPGTVLLRPITWDSCTDPYASPHASALVGDGDEEVGVSGGFFPAYQPCLSFFDNLFVSAARHPTIAHHGAYEGAAFAAVQDAPWSGLGIVAFAGTDGQEHPLQPCVGDGVIDDLNPVDCGSGVAGAGIGGAVGTVVANAPLLHPITGDPLVVADCTKPADGSVWVVIPVGPVMLIDSGPFVYATPFDLCIEQAIQPSFPAIPACINLGSVPTDVFVSVPVTGTIEQVA